MNYDYGKCHVCESPIEERLTNQSVNDQDEWVLIRSVPTGVCTKCGEQVFRAQVAKRLEEILRQRHQRTPEVCIKVPVFPF